MFDSIIHFFNDIVNEQEINLVTGSIRLILSFVLGILIGTERQTRKRDAGMRTFTLICLGSTTAMLISIWIPQSFPNFLNGDPGRVAAQVLTGIGFLGAGAIIRGQGSIQGLTTAACIWSTSVIGLAIGAGMYTIGIVSTLITLFVLVSMEKIEKRIFLDGVNRIMEISCHSSNPNLEDIRHIFVQNKISVISQSFEYNYDKDTAVLTYKVNIGSNVPQQEVCNELKNLKYISGIKLMA